MAAALALAAALAARRRAARAAARRLDRRGALGRVRAGLADGAGPRRSRAPAARRRHEPRPRRRRRCSTCARSLRSRLDRPAADAAFAATLRPLVARALAGAARSRAPPATSRWSTARAEDAWLRDRFHPGLLEQVQGVRRRASPARRARSPRSSTTRASAPASADGIEPGHAAGDLIVHVDDGVRARWSCGGGRGPASTVVAEHARLLDHAAEQRRDGSAVRPPPSTQGCSDSPPSSAPRSRSSPGPPLVGARARRARRGALARRSSSRSR